MEQKHSDDLFRDKLSDYSQHPDPKVWERISRSLDQRKSRRIVPIWWRLGGAAAILALALYLIAPWNTTSEFQDTPAITDQPAETPGSTEPAGLPGMDESTANPSGVADIDDPSGVAETNNPSGVANTNNPSGVAETDDGSGVDTRAEADGGQDILNTPSAGAVAGTQTDRPDVVAQQDASTAVAATASNRREVPQGQPADPSEDKGKDLIFPMESEGVAANLPETQTRTQPKTETKTQQEDPEADQGQSIFDAIEEQEALAEVQSQEDPRWTVGPSLAPVYFDSFGDGSPIAQNFVQNTKSGTTNMSYGVAVSYAVSKKLSLRSGVHRVDYGYNTNQVSFSSNPNAGPSSLIQTISYSEDSKNLVVHSTAGNTAVPVNENVAIDVTAPTAERQGTMEQQFGYLEVPFELQYAVIDRRFGLNVIGGMSSMFLVDNRVTLNSLGQGRTEMGEARNLNSLNFSGNFGLGFYYNLSSSLQLNMQPMFKYQLNTFTETAGAFRPFSVGVYSGLSFMF